MAKDVGSIAEDAYDAAKTAWRRAGDGTEREAQLVMAMSIAALAAAIAEWTAARR